MANALRTLMVNALDSYLIPTYTYANHQSQSFNPVDGARIIRREVQYNNIIIDYSGLALKVTCCDSIKGKINDGSGI